MISEPLIKKESLWQTAGESIQDPSAWLGLQPFRHDREHQLIRQIFSP